MERLIALLRGASAPSWEITQAKSILMDPWCWPVHPELQTLAQRFTSLQQPPPPRPGEVLLVSVDGERASLWRWTVTGKDLPFRELIQDAKQSEALAWDHARRHVPFIAVPALFRRRPACRALKVASNGIGTEERALTGTSFGLALGLAAASQLMDACVPADVVALAALGSSGETLAVDSRGLEVKLSALGEYALGMKRVLVHPDQAQEVRRRCGTHIDVIEVCSLVEAIAVIWPAPPSLARDHWQNQAVARSTNEHLYRMALENSPSVLDWRPVAASAAMLRELLSDHAPSARKARFAEEVARRHLGVALPLAWAVADGSADMPHPDWLQILAHDVQSWADTGATAEECVAAAEGALREVAPPDKRHPADLKLLGAIGRALAAAGCTRRSIEVLREAVDGWRQLHMPDDASYPLCELIRVLGISNAQSELDTAIAETVSWARSPDVEIGDASAAFIALAVGRALITVGEAARGIEELSDDVAPWDRAPSHVRLARLRWLARGYTVVGLRDLANQQRQELWRAAPTRDAKPNMDLAHLDAALESGTDLERVVTKLLDESHEFQRLHEEYRQQANGEGSAVELARWLSDRYRY